MRPIGQRITLSCGMFGELVHVLDFKSKMRQIGADYYWSTSVKFADLNFFVASRCFQKDELRTAPRCVASNLLQPQNIPVERDRLFQIVHAVARVQYFFYHAVSY